MRPAFVASLLCAAAVLVGCDPVGPNYERPQADVPSQFTEAGPWKIVVPQETIGRGDWWSIFDDPELNSLQAEALRRNPDLKAVAQRVLQAQAVAGISRSYLYPEVNSGAVGMRYANNPNFATLVDPAMVTPNDNKISNAYKVIPLYASYEIDFWGRVRRQTESASAELGSSIAAYHTALLTLTGDVTQTYFDMRATDELYRLIDENIKLHRDTFNLIRARRVNGLANELAEMEVETAWRTTQAQAQTLGAQRVALANKLAMLTGTNPESFAIGVRSFGRQPVPAVPVGLPSDLLQRRPDIAQAEREIAAANARIGVAVAAYFPAIVLTSSVGYESFSLSTLTNPTSNIWGVGVTLFQQLFNAGRIGLNVERSRAAYEEKVALYQASLLKAFQEVETALARLRLLDEQARFQREAVASASRTAALAAQRFKQGLASMLDVLTTQRAALAAQSVAVQVANDQFVTTVALVKALGGGWQDRASQLPQGSPSMWAPGLKQ